MGKWRLRGIKSLTELYLNAGPSRSCPIVLLFSGLLAKDGGKAGWAETRSEMMLIGVQQRADQRLSEAVGLRGKEGGAIGLCSCLGRRVIAGGLWFGEGRVSDSGSGSTFKSLQGSLQAEGIVLSCVAPEGRDCTKGKGNELLGQAGMVPITEGIPRGWRGCRGCVPGGPGLGDLFQFPFHCRISALGVVLGLLPPHFSHSILQLPLFVHLGKLPMHVEPAGLLLGESLPRGLHSAQLTCEWPFGMSASEPGLLRAVV